MRFASYFAILFKYPAGTRRAAQDISDKNVRDKRHYSDGSAPSDRFAANLLEENEAGAPREAT
jgi:hypothetical protein